MKTISVVASNRPTYTAECLSGVTLALMQQSEAGKASFDKLLISLDPDSSGKVDGGVEKLCEKVCSIITQEGLAECEIYANNKQLGCGRNHYAAMDRAFELNESDYNLLLEDDARLTDDAVHLANWFYECHNSPLSDYALLSMCNHRGFGRGSNPGGIPDDPSFVVESPYLTAPFAWAANKSQWPFLRAVWLAKLSAPNGWDFSISYWMRLARKRALHPVLSRCRNVGRVGMHETPDSFSRTQEGLKFSDGTYVGGFRIVGRLPQEELLKVDDWMETEYRRMFPR